jgi:hypothetical protein
MRTPDGRAQPGHVVAILERHRDAVERAADLPSPEGRIGCLGRFPRSVGLERHDGVQRAVVPRDALEMCLEHLDGRQLAPL